MTANDRASSDDLRRDVSDALARRSGPVVADAVTMFPLVGIEHIEAGDARQIGGLLLRALAQAVRDGRIDPRGELVTELHRLARSRSLALPRVFTFAYLAERSALDELALHERLGSMADPWPSVVQLVRRASFDLLAAVAERAVMEPTESALLDPTTTLYARSVFDAVLGKELDRAGRLGQSVSLALFDVDRLADLNQSLGPGVGDKLLERLGSLIRGYFRRHDWVARYADDTFAVLLTATDAKHAKDLADRVRATVADRLAFTDHRTGEPIAVTVTAAVITREVAAGEFVDPERLVADCQAVLRAYPSRSS